MFTVRFTLEAKSTIAEQASRDGFTNPVVMIHRQGPNGDVTRTGNGQVQWYIERPHPWKAQLGDSKAFGDRGVDVNVIDGVHVWLALIPRTGELGVEVSVQHGELFVETINL